MIVTFDQARDEARKVEDREGYTLVALRMEFVKYVTTWTATFMVNCDGIRTVEMTIT